MENAHLPQLLSCYDPKSSHTCHRSLGRIQNLADEGKKRAGAGRWTPFVQKAPWYTFTFSLTLNWPRVEHSIKGEPSTERIDFKPCKLSHKPSLLTFDHNKQLASMSGSNQSAASTQAAMTSDFSLFTDDLVKQYAKDRALDPSVGTEPSLPGGPGLVLRIPISVVSDTLRNQPTQDGSRGVSYDNSTLKAIPEWKANMQTTAPGSYALPWIEVTGVALVIGKESQCPSTGCGKTANTIWAFSTGAEAPEGQQGKVVALESTCDTCPPPRDIRLTGPSTHMTKWRKPEGMTPVMLTQCSTDVDGKQCFYASEFDHEHDA
ncbi:hypothetical protein BD324DRAFT_617203 [Kockovaella imperatae]|uniref:Uncharacterized protein n=1 Tax=Kockovaella imperatae TaxID=4999 RepID=A0A1Y1US19_9TREE|nr:hypothetical protein BD324DRAFT_617203 [Kockovaella imperatae]ORX40294.1 hypothetical protein BD324DRAFT_617203 [Kockovaella imperatae]